MFVAMEHEGRHARAAPGGESTRGSVQRLLVIATTAFLTVVDLFAVQAILPALTKRYETSPALMGLAINASTIGMAVGSLGVALLSQHLDRRRGIVTGLLLLTIPTTLLGFLPDLATFAGLRVAQGLCISAAFTLTLAYLAEHAAGPSAVAAYITGNVGSNLVGRLISAGVADHFGLAANFYVFAGLNLVGALLAFVTFASASESGRASVPVMRMERLFTPALLASFGIGFCILFAFIGTFTFVNFVLVREPISLGMMQVGLVYLVFLPSIITTPLASAVVRRFDTRLALLVALGVALAALPLLLLPSLPAILCGLVIIAVGTFFAQAVTTGFVGRAASADRGLASGLYLACYFSGGLVGSVVLGQLFELGGWPACVAGIGFSLAGACLLAMRLRLVPSLVIAARLAASSQEQRT